MKLLQLVAGQIRLNEPLPWSVRSEQSELLLSKGFVITSQRQLESLLERGMFVDQEEFERHRAGQANTGRTAFDAWGDTVRKAALLLLKDPRENPQFKPQLAALSGQLQSITNADADIGAFELAHMERVGYPVLHSLQVGYLATLVARRLGFDEGACDALVNASLTMNLSMLQLQGMLCEQRQPPNEVQREAIRKHPLQSRALLEQSGIDDRNWLVAVEQHHERPDGSGYPRGLSQVEPLAAVLHHADIYLAKIAGRRTRPAMPVHEAARVFFVQQDGARNPVVAAIIKEMGIYPPGAYVKLANGETAVVVRRGENAATPQVYSLTNTEGIAFAEPVKRDTRQPRFKVVAPVASANVMVRIDRARLFAS
jgi:HD-GYP domain-containing protein (c-di-GMP phosphodiesterase class II)